MFHDAAVIEAGTALAVISLCSIPALLSITTQLTTRNSKQEVYEDADGKSTPAAVQAFSLKFPKALILLAASAGFGLSLAYFLLSWGIEDLFLPNLLGLGAWTLLLFQAVGIASTRSSVQAYNLGLSAFLSSATVACLLFAQGAKLAGVLLDSHPLLFYLLTADLALSVTLAFASLAIPRRPDVFYNGNPVDAMYTTSAWNLATFSWVAELLALARKKKNVDMSDLPEMDHWTRAAETSADWRRRNSNRRLWLSLALAHFNSIAIQWMGILLTSLLGFGPQWVMLQLLTNLERKESGEDEGQQINNWIWVICLGVVILANSWVESMVYWLSFGHLCIPVRSQLAALIFEKSMRRKDVKGTSKSKDPSEAVVSGPAEVDETEAVNQSKQNTVNLVGVDGKRVSDFATFQYLFIGSLAKLVISLTFLVTLLGWIPLLAGFSAMLAITPLNVRYSKRYGKAQDKLMKLRDEKTAVVTEALQGIRQIKFSALEPEWEDKINAVREKELASVWSVFIADTMLMFCWIASPTLLSAIALSTYALIHGQLTPSIAFVSLGVFKALELTLSVVPELTTDALDAWVSTTRIEEYLNSPDLIPISKDGPEIAFENASLAWPADEGTSEADRFVLRDVNITFPEGELSVISGKTGSGKSLMLSAILGEVDLLSGSLYVPKAPPLLERHDNKANKGNWIIPKAIAYVAQIPWIENASIQDNILFGLPYDEDRYNKTVEYTALKKDLEMLTDGGETEVGAQGVNLSGGQKWRVTLARAIYSRAGILVLDDIFSAVDAHVGRHIFEKCLTGELCHGRTRILVTHHVALCEPKTKYLVELGLGRVLNAGLLSDLRQEGTLQKIKSHEQTEQEIQAEEAPTAVNSDGSSDGDDDDGGALRKVASKAAARKFVEEEAREKGAIRKKVYLTYLKDSGGWPFWLGFVVVFFFVQFLTVARSWWLKTWTGDNVQESVQMHSDKTIFNMSREHGVLYALGVQQTWIHAASAPSISVSEQHGVLFYLGIYTALAVGGSIAGTLKFLYVYFGSVQASRKLFAKINFIVLRAPLRWLDTVPVGRILNRMTSDFSIIDSQLAASLAFGVHSFLALVAIVVSGFFVSPLIVVLASILLLICLHYALRYLVAARPVKRLESNSKSPVFEQFGTALTGVTTIRGFDKAEVYIQRMYSKIDQYARATWYLWLFNRWMGWRMALVGSFFSALTAAVILATPGMSAALAGFALAFSLEFSGNVIFTIRHYASIEINLNSVERIVEWCSNPTEDLGGESPPAAWPTGGSIEVDKLVVGYADDLPPVLKGLSFRVNSNERIGVVGRTGAGKSSLTLALFRFLEAKSGKVYIDGLDISKIKLHDLRSRLAIIPQDPVLFSGTIRSNLDPFNNHTDAALRDCLERVHLVASSSSSSSSSGEASPTVAEGPKNANVFQNLNSPVSEGGLNLSQGQRQLLCLARAIIGRPRVMVLDEATSAVDMQTDKLIQRSIREEFTEATLLVIAHRLSTIADFDRILVLSDGVVAEYGSPRELWDKGPAAGVFRAMCEESGETEKLRKAIHGEL